MLIKTIDFPLEVLQAQKDGRLVVFAGAGVSMPPPANLPSFSRLAQMIGAEASPQRNREPDDQYLGRLFDGGKGLQVRDLAARILLNEGTKPTDLHFLLLQIFDPALPIRLVTTNFDNHFSAASQACKRSIETFCAPALPLGNDFEGIVYLHGSAAKSSKKLVLTDGDFGQAYLTHAWASRFLYQMFSTYTVLFVGYSHDDVVMRYLARGLPPESQSKRFAFAAKDDDATWHIYGIKPLLYEKRDGPNEHYPITEAVREWVSEIQRGLLEKSQRISSIVEAKHPLEGEDGDYLKYSLHDADTARQFTNFAKDPDYIEWLEGHGFLRNLFDLHACLTPVETELVSWLVSDFLAEHPQEVLALFQRNGPVLHPELCRSIHSRLAYCRKQPGVNAVYPTWVTILLSQPHTSLRDDDWAQLLADCRWPDDKECAVFVFDFVTQPRILLERQWTVSSNTEGEKDRELVRYSVDLERGLHHWLSETWDNFFKPRLSYFAFRLEPIVTGHLQTAHALLSLNKNTSENYDALSFRRQTIRQESGPFPRVFDALVNAARDILELILRSDASAGAFLIERWFASGVPILSRLSVHGISESPALSADEKIHWIIERDLVFGHVFKAEVFDVLQRHYPSSGTRVRKRLIDLVLLGPQGEKAEGLSDTTKQYEIFNLLVWLLQADQNCQIAQQALFAVRKNHPEFSEREHPNLNYWISSGWGPSGSRFSLDEILAAPPGDFLNRISDTPKEVAVGEGRAHLTYSLVGLVQRNTNWGIDLQAEMIRRDIRDPDIWVQVFNGWREATMNMEAWFKWFEQIEKFPEIDFCADGIADVLYARAARKEWAIPDELMDRAYGLAQQTWEALERTLAPSRIETDDWLDFAINRPGGKLARFWLEYISILKGRLGDQWTGLPSLIKNDLVKAACGRSAPASLARVVIASQFHYFFYLDADFARKILLPLFDWKTDVLRATQCWHGFIGWGQWKEAYLDDMLPFYEQALSHLGKFRADHGKAFAGHIAGIAILGRADALAEGWLYRFIREFGETLRADFARVVEKLLEGMDSNAKDGLWSRWLRQYWDNRNLGKPVALEREEINTMARWPLHLGAMFPEAVDLLAKAPLSPIPLPFTTKELEKRGLSQQFPAATAQYLLTVLHGLKHRPYDLANVKTLVSNLENAGVCSSEIRDLKNEILRLE